MANAISSIPVWSEHLSQWGTVFCEYDYVAPTRSGGTETLSGIDLEDVAIKVSNRRATIIESQIEPMAVRMQKRNKELDNLSAALGDMASFSAKFVADKDGKIQESVKANLTNEGLEGLKLIGITKTTSGTALTVGENTLTKSDVDSWTQKLQGAADSRNNAAQKDMTRMQSLVDRRDESYKMSSSLAEKVAGTRGTTIKNM